MPSGIFLGKASRLCQKGDSVTVRLSTNKTVTCKATADIVSPEVAVFQARTGQYHAVPQSPNWSRANKTTTFFKRDVDSKKPKPTFSVCWVLRVQEAVTVTPQYTCTSWRYDGAECVPTGGAGEYATEQECLLANERFSSVGYYKPGYLAILGAPTFNRGFFYPIGDSVCGQRFFNTGTSNTIIGDAFGSVVTGNPLKPFESRSGVLPMPDASPGEVILQSGSRFITHWSYGTSGHPINLPEWNSIYNAEFYRPGNTYSGNNESSYGDIPWEVSYPLLNPDGSYVFKDDTLGIGGKSQVFGFFGIPNYVWRKIELRAIAIGDTIYHMVNFLSENIFEYNAKIIKSELNQPENFYIRSIDPTLSPTIQPAEVISTTYKIGEPLPVPPETSGTGWQLLWDTSTCPPTEPTTPDPDEFWIERIYVLDQDSEPEPITSVIGGTPSQVHVSKIPGGYYGSVKDGTRFVNRENSLGEPYQSIEWCRITTFTNQPGGSFSKAEYMHEETIDTNVDDWQAWASQSWLTIPPPRSPDPCLDFFSSGNTTVVNEDYTVDTSFLRWFETNQQEDFFILLELGQLVNIVSDEGESILVPLQEAVKTQPCTATVYVMTYTSNTTIANPRCEIGELYEYEIELDALNTGFDPDRFVVEAVSVCFDDANPDRLIGYV